MEAIQDRYHALLIGIDNYPRQPLAGCVNDIDVIQHILLDRVGLAPERIRRLASPHPGGKHDTRISEQRASLANLRSALAELGSDKVLHSDRIFIYYSGHGTRLAVQDAAGTFFREALVPVDLDEAPERLLLFDFELNVLLEAIAARTPSVTFVMDCCYAAGATRTDGVTADASPVRRDRFLDLSCAAPIVAPRQVSSRALRQARLAGHGIDDCQVVAACHGHQVAKEALDANGVLHGLLTSAFVSELAAVPNHDLLHLPWNRIWYRLCSRVERANSLQNPWMSGSVARAVFGGPPAVGDAGFAVIPHGDGYQIQAGESADVTVGTELAIYGDVPPAFPALGTTEDHVSRVGVVRVTTTETASALASAVAPFALPAGARARIIKAGALARLCYAVVPSESSVERSLGASPLLQAVAPNEQPEVMLQYAWGRWFVTDVFHGPTTDGPVLCALWPSDIGKARVVLEHYYSYSRSFRMARRLTDLPDALQIAALRWPGRSVTAAEAQAGDSSEWPMDTANIYRFQVGAQVCFRARNHSRVRLKVTLINAAADGCVAILGEEVIEPGAHHVFWSHNAIGNPFTMTLPNQRRRGIDRLIAIGTTKLNHSLRYLQIEQTFDDLVNLLRTPKNICDAPPPPVAPIEQWAMTQVVLETRVA